jgi:hypothetical protein
MSRRLPTRRTAGKLASVLALLVAAGATSQLGAAPAGGPTPFADVLPGAPVELADYQVKLTWTGVQEKSTPTLLLHGSGRAPDVDELVPHYTPDVHYTNDDDHTIAVAVDGPTAIGRLLGGFLDRPHLQTPGGPAEPVMSVMIQRGIAPFEIVFEHLATPLEAIEIVNVLQAAVVFEPADTRDLARRFRNFTVGQF